ncbi:MAG: hypothetical protein M1827_005066 [Pycnora praestabilis]|nr:MAG: hypothetical protein M1827_005066 [Pycnora praestabilis]
MELYGCGLNAHNQLKCAGAVALSDPPKDLHKLQAILKARSEIRIRYIGWSAVIVDNSENAILCGDHFTKENEGLIWCRFEPSNHLDQMHSSLVWPQLTTFFGDHNGPLGAVSVLGRIWTFSSEGGHCVFTGTQLLPNIRVKDVTIAGNGRVVAIGHLFQDDSQSEDDESLKDLRVVDFSSFREFLNSRTIDQGAPMSYVSLPQPRGSDASITTLVSNETAFTVLTSSGEVYTWGDARHNHLGRTITSDTPASKPCPVDFLGGIPIKKVASGGWMSAALSCDNDLYLWGGRPGESHRIKDLPLQSRHADGDEEEEPLVALANIDGGVDVTDVAIGSGHVLVLCADGRLFAAGRGENGQLGVGVKDFAEDWVQIPFGWSESVKLLKVYCGPYNSFVLGRVSRQE